MPSSHCAVVGCHNGTYGLQKWKDRYCDIHKITYGIGRCICEPPFKLFSFPSEAKDGECRNRWIKLVNRKDVETGQLWMPNYQSRICSKHFVDGIPTPNHPDPTLHMENFSCQLRGRRRKIRMGEESPPKKKSKFSGPAQAPHQIEKCDSKTEMIAAGQLGVVKAATALLELAKGEEKVQWAFRILQNAARQSNDTFFTGTINNPAEVEKPNTVSDSSEQTVETAKVLLELAAEENKKEILESKPSLDNRTKNNQELSPEISETLNTAAKILDKLDNATEEKKVETVEINPDVSVNNQISDKVDQKQSMKNTSKTAREENLRTNDSVTKSAIPVHDHSNDINELQLKIIKDETIAETSECPTYEVNGKKYRMKQNLYLFNKTRKKSKLKRVLTKLRRKVVSNNKAIDNEDLQVKTVANINKGEISVFKETALKLKMVLHDLLKE